MLRMPPQDDPGKIMYFSIQFLIEFLILGAFVGFLTGLFGIGGGVFLVPTLLFIFLKNGISLEIATPMAAGTSLAVAFVASFSTSLAHKKRNSINYRLALILIISGVIGAQLGAICATHWDPVIVTKLFGMIVSLLGIYVFLFQATEPLPTHEDKRFFIKATLIGFGVSFLSGCLGIGGGSMMIPMLILFLDIPGTTAVGTSSLFMTMAALSGVAGYIIHGWDIKPLPPLSLGYLHYGVLAVTTISIFSVNRFGVALAHKMNPKLLARLLAALLLLIGLRSLF